MARHTTLSGNFHSANLWRSLERALNSVSHYFDPVPHAESGLAALQRESDRIRLQSRHWLM